MNGRCFVCGTPGAPARAHLHVGGPNGPAAHVCDTCMADVEAHLAGARPTRRRGYTVEFPEPREPRRCTGCGQEHWRELAATCWPCELAAAEDGPPIRRTPNSAPELPAARAAAVEALEALAALGT